MRSLILILSGYRRVPALRRGFVLLAALLALLWSQYSYRFEPSQFRFSELKSQVIDFQNQLSDLKMRADLSEEFDRLTVQYAGFRKRFDAKVDRSGIVERMAQISSLSGTRIIHGSNSFGQPQFGVIPVFQDLTVEGTYQQNRNFITHLARIETLTLLRSVEFSSTPDGSQVRMKMRLVTFSTQGQ